MTDDVAHNPVFGLLLLLALIVLYVLSIGPVVATIYPTGNGIYSDIPAVYAPVGFVCDRVPYAGRTVQDYIAKCQCLVFSLKVEWH